MRHIFTQHPNSVGETYWQHLRFALKLSLLMFLASLTALIHGILPFIFIKTSSGILYKLLHKFENSPRSKLLAEHEKEQH